MSQLLVMISILVCLLVIGVGGVIDNQRMIKRDLAKIKEALSIKEEK